MPKGLELDKLKQWFSDSESASFDSRALSEKDRDYLDGNQLTSEEIAELKSRGQPIVVMNRIRSKVNWMRGLEMQRRTDPKGFARQGTDQQGADAMTDAMRFVVDNTKFTGIRSKVWDNMLIEGFGGAEVVHVQKRERVEVAINHYHWDRLFADPHSREMDFSDARYKGIVVWNDVEELRHEFGLDAVGEDELVATSESLTSDTFDDKPRDNVFLSRDRKRARLILMYYRHKGDWWWARFTGSKILKEGKSQYLGESGETICPLVMQSLYVDRNNNRYGMVRDFISPQDEINKRRSKALWQSIVNQTLGDKGAVDSVDKLKKEMARADGHIELSPDKRFEIIPAGDRVSAHLALLQEAKSEIDGMASNAVLEGEAGESSSGRAVLARQQGGLVEIAPPFDALGNFNLNIYTHIWWMIKQTWTEERWIRVTDDERNTRFVGINRPFTVRDQLKELPEEQALQFARQEELRPDDPRLSEVVGTRNKVEEINIDVTIEDVPDTMTVRGETFDALVALAPTTPPNVQLTLYELLIESAPLRADVRDRLIKGMRDSQQQSAQLDQAEREATVIKSVAESVIAEKEAKAPLDQAS